MRSRAAGIVLAWLLMMGVAPVSADGIPEGPSQDQPPGAQPTPTPNDGGDNPDACADQKAREKPSVAAWKKCLASANATLAALVPDGNIVAAVEHEKAEAKDKAQPAIAAAKEELTRAAKAKKLAEEQLAKAKEALEKAPQDGNAKRAVDDAQKAVDEAATAVTAATQKVAAAPAVAPGPIERAAVRANDLATELTDLEKAADPATAFADNDCGAVETICVDHHGAPFFKESIPTDAAVGTVFTVKAFLTTAEVSAGETIQVTFVQRRSPDTLFGANPKKDSLRGGGDLAVENADEALHAKVYLSPAVDEGDAFTITVTNQVGDVKVASRSYTVRVRQGYAYYTVSLLMAATTRGSRTIRTDLTVFEDTAVDGAFALNVFPFGRPRGTLGFWRDCDGGWKRCLGRSIALTAATDIDLSTPFDRLFFGLSVEPVAGFALSAGLSLRQVQFAPAGASLPDLAGATDAVPVETGRVLRPYIGISLSLDLLDSLAEFKKAAAGISF